MTCSINPNRINGSDETTAESMDCIGVLVRSWPATYDRVKVVQVEEVTLPIHNIINSQTPTF